MLRAQNEQLAAANAQARQDLEAAGSPAAMEEAARKQGFARPGEQVYIIVRPSVSPSSTTGSKGGGVQGERERGGFWETLARWWKILWH